MPDAKIKKPKTVRFHHDTGGDLWQWEISYSNGREMIKSDWHKRRAAMLHNLALVHGRELAAGDTVINGRQHDALRWDLDAALNAIGLEPYSEVYS